MADRSTAYYIDEEYPNRRYGQGESGYRPNGDTGYAGPYGTDIPMETYNQDGRDRERRARPRSEGFDHQRSSRRRGHTWETGDDITDTAELLESLPSRQLEALTSGKHTLRHRRHKSFHGTIHRGDLEEISRNLQDDPDGGVESDVIRDMTTATLSNKREIKRHLSSRKKKHVGQFTRFKYSIGMGWQHFKYQVAEVMYSLELWKSHLKKIEGHFGTGVKSYFLFLKWLFLINIPIFLLTFGFVVLPQVLQRWLKREGDANSPTSKAAGEAYPERNVSFTGKELLTGKGWFNDTELYYGFYTSNSVQLFREAEYKMIYAYLFTCGGYYLLCLIILAQSILRSYRKYYIEGSSELNFVSKVFCGWDYGITSKEAAFLKHRSVYNDLREFLSGKKKKTEKSLEEKCAIFWTRMATNVVVLGLVGGSGYLVWWISTTQSLRTEIEVLASLALPLVITAINVIVPGIFSLIEHLERYEKPKNELYIHMIRTMTLRATNLGVLVYFWFIIVPADKNTKCWENIMGQEIYRLVIIDFLFTLLYTLLFEFVRKLISSYCWKKLEKAEFAIGGNTLDLIYSQALCWLGTFYSPLLSAIVIIKLWIIFYVKRISVIQNCKPSMRPWRAARSHTIFLGFLFCFFLLTTAAVICGIIFIKPSPNCGPYKHQNTTYQVVIELVDSWKGEQEWLRSAIHFITSPGSIAAVLVMLCMGTYYMRIAMIGHKEMVSLLQQQLALEGKDKNFLLNLLQEVSRKSKKAGNNAAPARNTRLVQGGDTSSVTSPGGRAFARQVVETSARM